MSDEIKVPVFVQAILSHEPAWCCFNVGFGLANLIYARCAVKLFKGEDVEETRLGFLDLLNRAQATIIAHDQDALAKIALEAYSDNTRDDAIDMMPADQFKAYMDNLRDEIAALKKENDE